MDECDICGQPLVDNKEVQAPAYGDLIFCPVCKKIFERGVEAHLVEQEREFEEAWSNALMYQLPEN